MKKFSIICCLVLLLNMFCPVAHVHAEEITTPTDTTCAHPNTAWKSYDQDTCMMCCIDCGEPTGVQQGHVARCTEPDVCHTCGSTDVNLEMGHTGQSVWETTTTTHAAKYDCCGTYWLETESHHASCDAADTTVCEQCNATGVTTELTHEQGYIYDDVQCGWGCVLCGELLYGNEMHEHNDTCTNPGVCDSCGQTGVTFAFTAHPSDGEVWTYDDECHSLVCGNCGETRMDNSVHYIICTEENTGVCSACGASGVTIELAHTSGTSTFTDETHHWEGCTDCGEPEGEKEQHYTTCDTIDGEYAKCWGCGETVLLANCVMEHSFEDVPYQYDETHHWFVCWCGEETDDYVELHEVYCDNPDADCYCGYTGTVAEVLHTTPEDATIYSDDTYHWWWCACGEEKATEKHQVFCQSPDEPCWCGYTGEVSELNHPGDSKYIYVDEETCANVCYYCDYVYYTSSHWSESCQDTICKWCEGEFAGGEHDDSNGYQYDADGHWFVCAVCGETDSKDNHYYDCGDPNTCYYCGYVNTGAHLIVHWWTDKWTVKDEYHSKVCRGCGEEYTIIAHTASCTNPTVCNACGATGLTLDEVYHKNIDYQHDDTHHWGVCRDCDETVEEGLHWTNCTKPNECLDCGAEGVTIDPDIMSHFQVDWNKYITNDTHHWYECACGEKSFYAEHTEYCYQPGFCRSCGMAGDFTVEHPVLDAGYVTDADSHWQTCAKCDGIANKTAHSDKDADGKCDTCDVTVAHVHTWGDPVTVAATCTADGSKTTTCSSCGEKAVETIKSAGHTWGEPVTVEATCTADGSKTTACANCDEKIVETIKSAGHAWGEPATVAATCTADGSKTTACANCDEKTVETIKAAGHAWGEPVTVEATCTADGSKTTACANCDEKTVETIKVAGHAWGEPVTVEATCAADGSITTTCATCAEATVEVIPATNDHTWQTVSNVAANCTKQGRNEKVCTVCDEISIRTYAAKGHSYGLVYVTQGNGNHAKTCADCGDKLTQACTLTTTDMGDMTCSACATCGYAVYSMNEVALEAVEGVDEAEAQIEVKRVENVSFEFVAAPAEEGTEEVTETETEPVEVAPVTLVVHETELEMTVELPDTVTANVKKVLAVSLIKEGTSIQPSNKVKLSIPVVEEEVTGMKLVLMTESGELVEVEYEIIDGVLVFETEAVGVFLFVEAEK